MPDYFTDDRMKLTIFGVVTAMWAVAFLADILSQNFEVSPLVHGLMASIIGYFVGSRLKSSK